MITLTLMNAGTASVNLQCSLQQPHRDSSLTVQNRTSYLFTSVSLQLLDQFHRLPSGLATGIHRGRKTVTNFRSGCQSPQFTSIVIIQLNTSNPRRFSCRHLRNAAADGRCNAASTTAGPTFHHDASVMSGFYMGPAAHFGLKRSLPRNLLQHLLGTSFA